jgi:hypothetical protein
MKPSEELIICRTPTPGKKPTRIKKWKFNLVHDLVLEIVKNSKEGVLFKDLSFLVEKSMDPNTLQKLGSVPWYTTTVKLEMEVQGEIKRIPGSNPQRLQTV